MSANVRKYQDLANWAPAVPVTRKVTQEDIAYALARRPAQSWQALARQLGRNEGDLRDACQGTASIGKPAIRKPAIAAPVEPEPEDEAKFVAGGPCRLPYRSRQLFALAAVSKGAVNRKALAEALDIEVSNASSIGGILRAKGLIDSDWALTEAGEAELRHQGLGDE